jgi:hypothetical protein
MAGGGAPRLLTAQDGDFQLWPSWSRDGRRIVFVSWNDQRLGEIRTVAADGSDMRTISQNPGHYRRPHFSPDGATLVYELGGGGGLTSGRWSEQTGIFRVPAAGGAATRILSDGANPHFGAASDRVFLEVSAEQKTRLVSVDLNGGNRRDHAVGDLITDYQVSPDGTALAFRENYNVYVVPFFAGAATMNLGARNAPLSVTRATREGGQFFHWTRGGQTLAWSMGPTLYTAATSSLLRTAPGGESYSAPRSGVPLGISVTADRPQGQVALVGARIVTMAGDDGGIIEDGVILIDGNRIRAVGRRGEVAIPAGAQQVDVAGKTIIPGLIDGHAHGSQGENDLVPQQNWSAMSHLALGVTTVHDPSSTASEIFTAAEMQRAGLILAPRTFSSGEIVYGARAPGRYAQIDSYEDALNHIRRLETQGAHSIKITTSRAATSAQQAAAAPRISIVVPEGGSLFRMDISLIQDGNTTVEHNLPQLRLYEDVVGLWSQTQVGNNRPWSSHGGLAGDPCGRRPPGLNHPLLSRHTPPNELAARVRAGNGAAGTVRRPA